MNKFQKYPDLIQLLWQLDYVQVIYVKFYVQVKLQLKLSFTDYVIIRFHNFIVFFVAQKKTVSIFEISHRFFNETCSKFESNPGHHFPIDSHGIFAPTPTLHPQIVKIGQIFDQNKQFWPEEHGFKYKISNVQAAIGCAQLERIENLISGKRKIFNYYHKHLKGLPLSMNLEPKGTINGYWLPNIMINEDVKFDREYLLDAFANENIDARIFFWPLSMLPMFEDKPQNVVSYSKNLKPSKRKELEMVDKDANVNDYRIKDRWDLDGIKMDLKIMRKRNPWKYDKNKTKKQDEKSQITNFIGRPIDSKKTKVRKTVRKKKKDVSNPDNKLQDLKDLKELYDEGLIDIDEFKQMKKEILGNISFFQNHQNI